MSASSDPLATALGGGSVKIKGLKAADADRLARLIEDSRTRQGQQLDAAIEGGLAHIPRLLRGTVKAVLFR
ncbi:MAG: hypothetical protein ACRD0U_03905 [Acidimicrobiales bacterium]